MMFWVRLVLSSFLAVGVLFSAVKIYKASGSMLDVFIQGPSAAVGAFAAQSSGKPFWQKNLYVVPSELWKVRNVQKNLHEGDAYFLLQEVEPNRVCLLGRFKLFQLADEKLSFHGEKRGTRSRLEQYALARRLPIRVSVVSGAQLSRLAGLNICSDWFHAENL